MNGHAEQKATRESRATEQMAAHLQRTAAELADLERRIRDHQTRTTARS